MENPTVENPLRNPLCGREGLVSSNLPTIQKAFGGRVESLEKLQARTPGNATPLGNGPYPQGLGMGTYVRVWAVGAESDKDFLGGCVEGGKEASMVGHACMTRFRVCGRNVSHGVRCKQLHINHWKELICNAEKNMSVLNKMAGRVPSARNPGCLAPADR